VKHPVRDAAESFADGVSAVRGESNQTEAFSTGQLGDIGYRIAYECFVAAFDAEALKSGRK
jgi:hypothetical protein